MTPDSTSWPMPRRAWRAALHAGLTFAALALAAGSSNAADDSQLELGKRLFLNEADPACAACHTLKAAGAAGEYGPMLDDMKLTTAQVTNAVRNGIGMMPSYKASLTEAQVQALARYVSTATGGPGK